MDYYDLSTQIASVYADHFETSGRQPVIGITGNYGDQTCKLAEGYYKQVIRAGGTPIIIPPTTSQEVLLSTLNNIDALLLSGGADINPLFCGEEPDVRLGGINAERDLAELAIVRLAANRQMPILGICRGIQTMAIALGGSVKQDISDVASIKHSQDADRTMPTHTVTIGKDSLLYRIFEKYEPFLPDYPTVQDDPENPKNQACSYVNSFHHQAVAMTGQHFRVCARSKDGIIEAIESTEMKPFLGVQWHPECLDIDGLPLFKWLVDEAYHYREAQQLHDRILSLDTHCDTPMFFSQDVDFGRRDEKILVDLPKMTEGRLDSTIMVCYLPQPKPGETFQQNVPFSVDGPKNYADLIFDKIEVIVANNSDRVALARTPDELWQNKLAGKKSIMLGIENGLALEGDLRHVEYFARRGVVYITLCHNGDNDICDSARGTQTHGGISDFGTKVIAEMNRLGVMIDLSHAAESSFYNALEMSEQPIVCSHSSARALCDHPRNLTDDQMRALARKGGVCQITLYNGFLKKDDEATILDAMAHLDHAIKVMGIDHVGLGTDFDGDGGIRGLADASELTLFTRQLLARSYSEADIQKIWGGNFLRVMREVQDNRWKNLKY